VATEQPEVGIKNYIGEIPTCTECNGTVVKFLIDIEPQNFGEYKNLFYFPAFYHATLSIIF